MAKKKMKYNPRAKHAYEDGGVVGAAKKNALMDLKSKMTSMGGDSLLNSLSGEENAYKDGGVVKASVMAKDKKGLKEGLKQAAKMMGKYEDGGMVESEDMPYPEDMDHEEMEESYDKYEDLSREELLALLKGK